MSLIGNLVGAPARDAIDKALRAAPATIDKTLGSAGTTPTATTAKATALFQRLYTQATTGIASWLPTTKPWLLGQLTKAATKAKAFVATL